MARQLLTYRDTPSCRFWPWQRAWFIPLVVAAAFVSACDNKSTFAERPAQLLTKQEMVSFLVDLHLTEAKMNYAEVRNADSLEILFRNYERHLMEEHGIDDSVYLQSYAYYLENMELLNDIYEDVVDSLSMIDTRHKAQAMQDTTDASQRIDSENQYRDRQQ